MRGITTAPDPDPRRRRRVNNVLLWIAQGLLAAAFLGAGIPKVFTPDKYIDMSPWADDVPRALLIFIGLMEILGALGVTLPRATKTLPWLTPPAALGASNLLAPLNRAPPRTYRAKTISMFHGAKRDPRAETVSPSARASKWVVRRQRPSRNRSVYASRRPLWSR